MGVVAWAWKLRVLLKKLIEWIASIDGGGIVPPPGDEERDWTHRWFYETITWADYTIADDWANADVGLYCPQPTGASTKTITLPEPKAGRWMTLVCFFQITGAWASMQWNIACPNAGTLFSMTSAEAGRPYGYWKAVNLTSYLDNDGVTWKWQYTGTVRSWDETTGTTLP